MTDVQVITTKEEWWEFIRSGKTITDFARKNGCAPCRALEPHFAKAAEKVEEVKFAKVYLDECDPEFMAYVLDELEIRATPTVLMYRYGALVDEIKGRAAPVLIKEVESLG